MGMPNNQDGADQRRSLETLIKELALSAILLSALLLMGRV